MANSRKFLTWSISIAFLMINKVWASESLSNSNTSGMIKINLSISENRLYSYFDGLIYLREGVALLLPAGLKLESYFFGRRVKPSLYGWLRGISFGKPIYFYEAGGSIELNLGRIKPVYFGFNPIINSLMLYSQAIVNAQIGYLNYGGRTDTQKYGIGLSFLVHKKGFLGFEADYFPFRKGVFLFRMYAQVSVGRFSFLPEIYTSTGDGPDWLKPFYILGSNVYGFSVSYEF